MDDFEELVKEGALRTPCTIRCTIFGRGKARRLSITFRASLLPADVVEVLRAPRFSVAYSPSSRTLRIKHDPVGQHQLSRAPKTDDVFLLRVPVPKQGVEWYETRVPVDPDVNVEQRAILIEMPEQMRVKPRAALPPPATIAPVTPRPAPRTDVTSEFFGDPHPSRSALATRVPPPKPTIETSETFSFPLEVGGINLSPQEAKFMELLLKKERVTMDAAGEAIFGSEGINPKVVQVIVSKAKTKMSRLGVDVLGSHVERRHWLSPTTKVKLRDLVAQSLGEA